MTLRRGYRGARATQPAVPSAARSVGDGTGVGLGLGGVPGGVELEHVADLMGHHEPEVVLADRPHQLGVDGDEPSVAARGGVPARRPVVGELRRRAVVAGAGRAGGGRRMRPTPRRRRTSQPAVPAAPARQSSEEAPGQAAARSWPGRCPGASGHTPIAAQAASGTTATRSTHHARRRALVRGVPNTRPSRSLARLISKQVRAPQGTRRIPVDTTRRDERRVTHGCEGPAGAGAPPDGRGCFRTAGCGSGDDAGLDRRRRRHRQRRRPAGPGAGRAGRVHRLAAGQRGPGLHRRGGLAQQRRHRLLERPGHQVVRRCRRRRAVDHGVVGRGVVGLRLQALGLCVVDVLHHGRQPQHRPLPGRRSSRPRPAPIAGA